MYFFRKWSWNAVAYDRGKLAKALTKKFLEVRIHVFQHLLLFYDAEGCSYASVTGYHDLGKENYVGFHVV